LEPIAEFVGEFEEGEVVDLLEAESLGEDAGGFEEGGHGEDFGWFGRFVGDHTLKSNNCLSQYNLTRLLRTNRLLSFINFN
jgi:hypothetical protein